MSVLDVGCGPGYVAAAVAERGTTPRGRRFFWGNGRNRAKDVSAN
jgi:ubiquinone/menaquinone biosynthesis C-methylase UbiE